MKTVRANTLKKGQHVYVEDGNRGFKAEILGFTDDKTEYGQGGVAFDSHKEMMEHYGVKSLKALEELQNIVRRRMGRMR